MTNRAISIAIITLIAVYAPAIMTSANINQDLAIASTNIPEAEYPKRH